MWADHRIPKRAEGVDRAGNSRGAGHDVSHTVSPEVISIPEERIGLPPVP